MNLVKAKASSNTGPPYAGILLAWLTLAMLFIQEARSDSIEFQSTETPPIWSETMYNNGMGGEILHLLSQTAGVTYSINYLPVKRFRTSIAPYIVGDPDILTEWKNRAIFPVAVFNSAYFYYRPTHEPIDIRSMTDIAGHTIGVMRGTLDNINQFSGNNISVEECDSVETLLRMLKKGRIDIAIMVDLTGRHLIKKMFSDEQDNFVQIVIPGTVRPIALMIDLDSPNGKQIAHQYRMALDKTKHDQQYHQILQKYYGNSTDISTIYKTIDRLQGFYDNQLFP